MGVLKGTAENGKGFLVPDFYKDFQCKCGACRRCCCEGWKVTVSETEYFRLLGEECSAQLRRRLDGAFFVPRDASPGEYAVLNHDYRGRCRLRREDGLCALQAELGEDALPAVCRLYPRGIRGEIGEATVANSCERVVEMLAQRTAPIRFERLRIGEMEPGAEESERNAVRMKCIAIMQERSMGIRQRMIRLGAYLCGREYRSVPFAGRMEMLLELARLYEEISPSISEACRGTIEAFDGRDEYVFEDRTETLYERFPYTGTLTENLLVNHMFFMKFPYSDAHDTVEEEYLALCGLFAFIRLLSAGSVDRLKDGADLVDLLADIFRVAEHTRFSHNIDVVFGRFGMRAGGSVAPV